jgi:hypothetical protein
MTKIAGSGSGSISQGHGSADPDPHQNVMDPENCLSLKKLYDSLSLKFLIAGQQTYLVAGLLRPQQCQYSHATEDLRREKIKLKIFHLDQNRLDERQDVPSSFFNAL